MLLYKDYHAYEKTPPPKLVPPSALTEICFQLALSTIFGLLFCSERIEFSLDQIIRKRVSKVKLETHL